jgi:hypothetical protein
VKLPLHAFLVAIADGQQVFELAAYSAILHPFVFLVFLHSALQPVRVVVEDLEGLRGLWCPQEGGHFARHLPEVRRRRRPYLHGLQHQVLQDNPDRLQG